MEPPSIPTAMPLENSFYFEYLEGNRAELVWTLATIAFTGSRWYPRGQLKKRTMVGSTDHAGRKNMQVLYALRTGSYPIGESPGLDWAPRLHGPALNGHGYE